MCWCAVKKLLTHSLLVCWASIGGLLFEPHLGECSHPIKTCCCYSVVSVVSWDVITVEMLLLVAVMCDCEDCLGRTPYASLIATTVMCIGVGLFCGTGFRALDITLNGIFEGLFKFHVSWYVALFHWIFHLTALCGCFQWKYQCCATRAR